MRKLWITLTYAVFLILIIAPLIKIFTGSWEDGWSGFVDALARKESLHASNDDRNYRCCCNHH